MEIIRLESADDPLFEAVYDWNYRWWGVRDGVSPAEVRCTLEHSLNRTRLPQTFVAVEKGRALGMYQLSMISTAGRTCTRGSSTCTWPKRSGAGAWAGPCLRPCRTTPEKRA